MKFISVSFVGVTILCQFSIIRVKSRNGEARICKYMLLRGERKKNERFRDNIANLPLDCSCVSKRLSRVHRMKTIN